MSDARFGTGGYDEYDIILIGCAVQKGIQKNIVEHGQFHVKGQVNFGAVVWETK